MSYLPMDTKFSWNCEFNIFSDVMKTFCPALNATTYFRMILVKEKRPSLSRIAFQGARCHERIPSPFQSMAKKAAWPLSRVSLPPWWFHHTWNLINTAEGSHGHILPCPNQAGIITMAEFRHAFHGFAERRFHLSQQFRFPNPRNLVYDFRFTKYQLMLHFCFGLVVSIPGFGFGILRGTRFESKTKKGPKPPIWPSVEKDGWTTNRFVKPIGLLSCYQNPGKTRILLWRHP